MADSVSVRPLKGFQRKATAKLVKTGLTALAVLLVVALGWRLVFLQEPVFQGKRLSRWLASAMSDAERGVMSWEARFEAADKAVRETGTNALPTLLRMLRARDSIWKIQFIELAQKQHIFTVRYRSAEEQNEAGQRAFQVLGAQAQCAVAALLEIAHRKFSASSHYAAIDALGNIGSPAKQAVPSLLQWATTEEPSFRFHAINALARIGAEPQRVVPMLIDALNDPNVRASAVFALGEFGTNARPAVPVLVGFLHSDKDTTAKSLYTRALRQIDPVAFSAEVSNSGVK